MENMEKKVRITKAQRFEDIKALLQGKPISYETDVEVAIEFLNHEIELLAKKNNNTTGEKKLTSTQKENETYKEMILDYLSTCDENGATCTQIFKEVPELSQYSSQKVGALCRQLKLASKVVSTEIKGRTYFKLA